MALTLAIENETQLPDGGPVSIRVTGRRGIDIGRDQHLDWTLPDPDRVISSTHCEIRYRDGGYWLTDVSRNGTFLNGSDRRLHEPHRLRNGDRLEIGRYIVAVSVDGEDLPAIREEPAPSLPDPDEIWGDIGEAPPPISQAELRPPPPPVLRSDFLDWAVELPEVHAPPPAARAPAPAAARPAYPAGDPDLAVLPGRRAPVPPQPDDFPDASDEGASAWGEVAAEWGRREAARPEPVRPAPQPRAAPPQFEAARLPLVDEEDTRRAVAPEGLTNREFLRRVARGAGIPESIFAEADAGAVAEEIGILLRIATDNVKQMLSARAESRVLVRSSRQTMIQAFDNNPLKFSPTAEDALRIMFSPPSRGYLGPQQALSQSFDDLRTHQVLTLAAMQQAVRRLAEDLDPDKMEKALKAERKGGVLASRRARLWDRYVEWWNSNNARDNGLLDTFMTYFSESYQKASRDRD